MSFALSARETARVLPQAFGVPPSYQSVLNHANRLFIELLAEPFRTDFLHLLKCNLDKNWLRSWKNIYGRENVPHADARLDQVTAQPVLPAHGHSRRRDYSVGFGLASVGSRGGDFNADGKLDPTVGNN
jgi:hypothetical protein